MQHPELRPGQCSATLCTHVIDEVGADNNPSYHDRCNQEKQQPKMKGSVATTPEKSRDEEQDSADRNNQFNNNVHVHASHSKTEPRGPKTQANPHTLGKPSALCRVGAMAKRCFSRIVPTYGQTTQYRPSFAYMFQSSVSNCEATALLTLSGRLSPNQQTTKREHSKPG
jgi:hypothetical protein